MSSADHPTGAASGGSHHDVFEALGDGFCVIEVLVDEAGESVDYRFVETNAAFEAHTGLRDALGRTACDLVPPPAPEWTAIFGGVAVTGEPARFVSESTATPGRWFDVFAFRVGDASRRRVALHFRDVTLHKRIEGELRYRSEQLQTLIDQAPVGIYLVDADLRIVQANGVSRAVFGDVDEPIGRRFDDVVSVIWPEPLADEIVRVFRRTLETGEPYYAPEVAEVRADRGVTEYYAWHVGRITLPDGRHGVVCYFSDISHQVETRRVVAESEDRYRTLFETIDQGFCIMEVLYDADGRATDYRLIETNPAFEVQTGVRDPRGKTMKELVPGIEPTWATLFDRIARTGTPTRFTDHAPSMGRWFDGYAFRIGAPEEGRVAALFTDVTERKLADEALRESEARLRHRAHHDALTGLPNRQLFEDRLHQALLAAQRHGRVLAVLFIDLDGFKLVNDSLGHAAGDGVLTAVARRLAGTLREGDTLARLHGDEFAVLLPDLAHAADADRVAHALLAEFSSPVRLGEHLVRVSASVGVTVHPRDGARDARDVLRAADLAMYRIKLGGKNGVGHYAASMGASTVDRAALAEHLDGALERGEIDVHYQPQWDSRTHRITTFEALLRWTSPVLGEVPPSHFVPVAAARGTFGPVASWCLDASAACARSLSDGAGLPLRIAVNVTATQITRATFVTQVEEVIARHRLEPQQLELELTIGPAEEGAVRLGDAMERLAGIGARLTLDRFSADAEMIAPLLDLPLDGVKLARALLRRADGDVRAQRGVAAVVALVHDLGLEVVAVGVETEAQRDLVLELGCERLQGSLIGAPMPRRETDAVLRSQRALTLF